MHPRRSGGSVTRDPYTTRLRATARMPQASSAAWRGGSMRRSIWLALAIAAGAACGGGPGSGGGTGSTAPDASVVAGEVEGESITLGELDARAKDRLYARETRGEASAVYELRQE